MSSGVVVAVVVLAAAVGVGILWRSQQGRLRAVAAPPVAAPVAPAPVAPAPVAPAPVAPAPADPVSLLLFTTPACGTCRQVRAVCAEIAGVRLVEVDATVEPERARSLNVWRAPTLFVLDAAGAPAWRTTGVPTRAALLTAVEAVQAVEAARAASQPAPSRPA
jgi:Thioredoxin